MHKSIVVLISTSALLSTPTFAAKPSFNCSKASHEIQKLICQDDELATLDVSLNNLYEIVLSYMTTAGQNRLKSEQIDWFNELLNKCWKADDKRACVKGEYETRINELEDR